MFSFRGAGDGIPVLQCGSMVGVSRTRPLRFANLVLLWAVVKLISIYAFVTRPNEYSDTYYYFLQCQKAAESGGGLAAMVPEYPTPAAALLMTPWWLGMQDYDSYRTGFVAIVVLFDLLFVLLLIARTSTLGVLAWIVLETLAGRLVLLRFDLIPAVLAGVAVLLLLQHRQHHASPVVAVGTAVKVWPIVLLPLMLGDKANRVKSLVAFAVTGVLAVAASVAAAGWPRLFTPLSYQSDRGLQIEAVAATVPMLARITDPAYSIFYSKFNAFEIAGPSIELWLRVATISSIVGALAFVVLLVRWFRTGASRVAGAYLALFEIAVFMTTSRALSPQYFLWLAAPAVVMLGVAWRHPERYDPWRPTVAFLLLGVLLALTIEVYPIRYDDILYKNLAAPMYILAVRNLMLIGLVGWTAWAAVATPRNPSAVAQAAS